MRYLLLLPLSVAMTLLAYVLAPVLPLFAREDKLGFHWLPKRLWYFQTPDNPLEGDAGHRERWMESSLPLYFQMVAWLWRNPAYGFEWDGPLAAHIYKTDEIYTCGDPYIKNRASSHAGSYFCTVGDYWNYKLIKPLFGDTALMLEFGWKLQGFAQGRETEGKAMYVFSVRLTAFNP